jgi:hypothetical protein
MTPLRLTLRPVPTHRTPLKVLDPTLATLARTGRPPVVLPVPVTGLTPVLRDWLRTR